MKLKQKNLSENSRGGAIWLLPISVDVLRENLE